MMKASNHRKVRGQAYRRKKLFYSRSVSKMVKNSTGDNFSLNIRGKAGNEKTISMNKKCVAKIVIENGVYSITSTQFKFNQLMFEKPRTFLDLRSFLFHSNEANDNAADQNLIGNGIVRPSKTSIRNFISSKILFLLMTWACFTLLLVSGLVTIDGTQLPTAISLGVVMTASVSSSYGYLKELAEKKTTTCEQIP